MSKTKKKIKINGVQITLSKKQLEIALKEFDKKEYKFTTDDNDGLYVNGSYIAYSGCGKAIITENLQGLLKSLSKELDIPILTGEEMLNPEIEGYGIDVDLNSDCNRYLLGRSGHQTQTLQQKMWTRKNFNKIYSIMNNKTLRKWFNGKFNSGDDK